MYVSIYDDAIWRCLLLLLYHTADCRQPGAHPSIIAPGLGAIPRLRLQQPPNLIPFTAATNLSSTLPTSSSSPGSISIFPVGSTGIIPGVSPINLLTSPHSPHAAAAAAAGMRMYGSFPSHFMMQYPTVGRHPSSASVIGGLSAGVGRLPVAPTFPFPFGYLPTAIRPPVGLAGFSQHGTATTASHTGGATHNSQFAGASPTQASRRTSVPVRSARDRDDSERECSTGSKNGTVSAEAYNALHTQSPSKNIDSSARVVSAESERISGDEDGLHAVDCEENRLMCDLAKRSRHGGRGDINFLHRVKSRAAETRLKNFHRYENGGKNVENSKSLPSAVPPLLKVVDSEDSEMFGRERSSDLQDGMTVITGASRGLPVASTLKKRIESEEVISSVIKHLQPQREVALQQAAEWRAAMSSVDYGNCLEKEDCRSEDCRYRNGEQRCRVSNSLSSGDEGPDSPKRSKYKSHSLEQDLYYCTQSSKLSGKDNLHHVDSSSFTGVSHKSLHNKSSRKRKSNLPRHNHIHGLSHSRQPSNLMY